MKHFWSSNCNSQIHNFYHIQQAEDSDCVCCEIAFPWFRYWQAHCWINICTTWYYKYFTDGLMSMIFLCKYVCARETAATGRIKCKLFHQTYIVLKKMGYIVTLIAKGLWLVTFNWVFKVQVITQALVSFDWMIE